MAEEKKRKITNVSVSVPVPDAVTKKDIADFFDVTTRQVERYMTEGMPFTSDKQNWYSPKDCMRWMYQKYKAENMTPLDIEKLRLTKAQADRKELEVKEIEADLLPVTLVLKTWQTIIIEAKTRILSIYSQVKIKDPSVSDKTIKIIKDVCRQTLEELGEDGQRRLPKELQKAVLEYDTDMDSAS